MAQKMMNSDTGGMHLPRASEHLETAWHWLCERRQHAPAQADVWHLRHHWAVQQQRLLATLLAGEYRLSPMLIVGQKGEQKALWSAQDALVLKWVALQIAPQLPLHARCEHIKGHEGGPASVRKMSAALKQAGYRWVLRTDVKGYYASIDKAQLLGQVRRHITHPVLLGLITQYVHYTVEDGGTFHTPEKGISRSCPLSPLMGALYLQEMDTHFGQEAEKGTMYYARYMDDIVVLTHSRWQLRKHVRILNRFLSEKTLCQHPDKTFIGRTVKGFDWMGAWLEPQGVTDIAPRAKANHCEKVRRLYERAWRWREPKAVTQRKVSNYRWRWTIWAVALLGPSLTSTTACAGWTVTAATSTLKADCKPRSLAVHNLPFDRNYKTTNSIGAYSGDSRPDAWAYGPQVPWTCNGVTYYGGSAFQRPDVLVFARNVNVRGDKGTAVTTDAFGKMTTTADLAAWTHYAPAYVIGSLDQRPLIPIQTVVSAHVELMVIARPGTETQPYTYYLSTQDTYGGALSRDEYDNSTTGYLTSLLIDPRVPPLCSLNASPISGMSIADDKSEVRSTTATVTCSANGTPAATPTTISLSLQPAGGSLATTPWRLTPAATTSVWVTASTSAQSSTTCATSMGTSQPAGLLLFDGSPQVLNQTWTGGSSTASSTLYFQACANAAAPGSYTAQATLSIVQS
ncbi:Retron-type reverse transcriptase [Serratia proteamaculans]|uniref:reverse transcriptase domain-containing protein n=1 Tax=Serratia proteamaculans TaxID=28151 RepID=UPI002182AC3A|nr:reverse transcriptase domain-containing protein [Serratia proteamaculans]CAI2536112.1 Retron-type reverse transcriptase [Serratia proteamaculans]